jgi:hypothetical protein
MENNINQEAEKLFTSISEKYSHELHTIMSQSEDNHERTERVLQLIFPFLSSLIEENKSLKKSEDEYKTALRSLHLHISNLQMDLADLV